MVVVIADDLTGAAEMAGIAWKHGMHVNFTLFDSPQSPFHDAQNLLTMPEPADQQVLVVATDTRSGTVSEARATIKSIMNHFAPTQHTHILFFKKTDSALRGHILAEVSTMMECLNAKKTLLIAQNPSKQRVVHDGIYYINGTPLSETSFCFDPEFPAKTSVAEHIIMHADFNPPCPCLSLAVDRQMESSGVFIADAISETEIQQQIAKADSHTLLAGAADTFTLFLKSYTSGNSSDHKQAEVQYKQAQQQNAEMPSTIIVCGSTQSKPLHLGIPTAQMPDDIFHGLLPAEQWFPSIDTTYSQSKSVILTIGRKAEGGKAYAVRLRETMAKAVAHLVANHHPHQLVVEGGATAFAILHALGWCHFEIENENAPGVVTLRYHHPANDVLITLKPGSYPWGNLPLLLQRQS